jgi:hypothetical protein
MSIKERDVMPTEPLKDNPSTYVVQDRDNQEEMTRLEGQDKMLTKGQAGGTNYARKTRFT